MNFVDPDSGQWQDLEELSREYEVLTEERVAELHEKLKPYFLRRTKTQVLNLPPKASPHTSYGPADAQTEFRTRLSSQCP